MRIVVSGTHASGKSTLISDFTAAHRRYTVLPDPFELTDSAHEEPDAGMFFEQLRVSAGRLLELDPHTHAIAERGPLDFLAYLTALDSLGRPARARNLVERGFALTAQAMARVDLLVLLPLNARDGIEIPADEDPELREAMNDALLEFADDLDLTGDARIVEIVGDPRARVAQLEDAIGASG